MTHFHDAALHRAVVRTDAHRTAMRARLKDIAAARPAPRAATQPFGPIVEIPLSTVSLNSNFDAYITVTYPGAAAGVADQLLVDSGNSVLILPYWEHIDGLAGYTVLGAASEPWGAPAKIVRGPIGIPTANGTILTINNCVFYACTGNTPDGQRTANFGTGCLSPWSANGWSTPSGLGVTMQAPLSYLNSYKYAVFDYIAATGAVSGTPVATTDSKLTLYTEQPAGFVNCNIIPDKEWMSVRPASLSIDGTLTNWPAAHSMPIAMVDTGGGPVLITDPTQLLSTQIWPPPGTDPGYMTSSISCQFSAGQLTLVLTDGTAAHNYTIDPAALPTPAEGLTAIICQQNQYLMNENGLNIGGISALINLIMVDYGNSRVGFKLK